MKNSLMMNFTVDKENKKIKVEREFAAPVANVWAAWTQPELLDQWWAPKPWKARTKSQEFKVGGQWMYAMVGPDGTEHWSIVIYKSIDPLKSFSGKDAFCDPNGVINEAFPSSLWACTFNSSANSTIVRIEIQHEKLSDLEMIIQMGFKEGFTAALENLDGLLK